MSAAEKLTKGLRKTLSQLPDAAGIGCWRLDARSLSALIRRGLAERVYRDGFGYRQFDRYCRTDKGVAALKQEE